MITSDRSWTAIPATCSATSMPSVSTWPIKNRCWTTGEISVFITPRALITVRKSAFDIDTLIARWDLGGELASSGGVSFLVYGLLDAVVDGH